MQERAELHLHFPHHHFMLEGSSFVRCARLRPRVETRHFMTSLMARSCIDGRGVSRVLHHAKETRSASGGDDTGMRRSIVSVVCRKRPCTSSIYEGCIARVLHVHVELVALAERERACDRLEHVCSDIGELQQKHSHLHPGRGDNDDFCGPKLSET